MSQHDGSDVPVSGYQSRLESLRSRFSHRRGLLVILVVGFALIVVVSLFTDEIITMVNTLIEPDLSDVSLQARKDRPPPKINELAKGDMGPASQNSPYENLPNPLPMQAELAKIWTAQQEEAWRLAITSELPWQRHKTVLAVKANRFKQSEVILWEAVKDVKFWTRMAAVTGLADFGIEVSPSILAEVVKDARPALVKNYFRRFYKKAKSADRYILRQALKVVDAPARREILTCLRRYKDPLSEPFLSASRDDSGLAGVAGLFAALR